MIKEGLFRHLKSNPDSLSPYLFFNFYSSRYISIAFNITFKYNVLNPVTAGTQPDMQQMLKEYYTYRGWDWETGRPTEAKLMELGLTRVAEDLYGA